MAFRSMLLVFTLLAVTFTMSSGQLITGGILGGVITCTNTSLAVAGTFPVIPNARVDLVCGRGSLARVVQSVVTNTAGVYQFIFTTLDTILNDPASCNLIVTLPPNTCFVNVPTGVLRIPIVVLRAVDVLVGRILIFVAGALSFVRI